MYLGYQHPFPFSNSRKSKLRSTLFEFVSRVSVNPRTTSNWKIEVKRNIAIQLTCVGWLDDARWETKKDRETKWLFIHKWKIQTKVYIVIMDFKLLLLVRLMRSSFQHQSSIQISCMQVLGMSKRIGLDFAFSCLPLAARCWYYIYCT